MATANYPAVHFTQGGFQVKKIRAAIIGVGNCASALLQGLSYLQMM
ncbi:hypothetical protein NDK47_14260 [Brevibacillus ruminantium]|uniref:Inositol-3-phosphate synthase n=1 Tax=Brevibacillus ruminantium TaxID=2950604 RepID=A0ABY4WDJ2_9BACL|nr:hypothetical protein [Brevibacillus ruminantium]USG63349.1 hypothetical protein NDK47_14260 [Brevibacillus ruminantium]